MNFIVSILHIVEDIERAADFLIEVLDFRLHSRSDEWIQVENGALSIRLVLTGVMARANSSLELEMSSDDLATAVKQYQAIEGIEVLTDTKRLSPERLEVRLRAPHNIVITVSKTFNEDELGVLPPLPTCFDWEIDAETAVQRLLRIVPIGFREQARRRVTEHAEAAAAYLGEVTVDQVTAIRSLVKVTPRFQHQALRAALQTEGLTTDAELAD